MDANEVKVPLEKAIRAYGVNKFCRDTGLGYATVRPVMKGLRVPTTPTAERIAEGLGVSVDDLDWPKGFGDPYRAALHRDEVFQAAVEQEVERRLAVAQRAMNAERTAAQSNESNVT